MQGLTQEQTDVLRKQQNILRKIDNGDEFFFNITLFELNWKLVKSIKQYGTESGSGRKVVVGHKYRLTEKGKRILNLNL